MHIIQKNGGNFHSLKQNIILKRIYEQLWFNKKFTIKFITLHIYLDFSHDYI